MEEPVINTTPIPESSLKCVIMLELVTEEGEYDPALINAVGGAFVSAFQQKGYTTHMPVYTGEKGGFLVEVVTTIHQITITVWNNHAAITEGIADLSSLVTIFAGILPMLKQIVDAYRQQVGKEESATRPIKLTVEIDGVPLMIETSDITQADAAINLALKYCSEHPVTSIQVTTKSKVKVQGLISARKRRKRR